MSRVKRCVDCNTQLTQNNRLNDLVCPKNTCERFNTIQNFHKRQVTKGVCS